MDLYKNIQLRILKITILLKKEYFKCVTGIKIKVIKKRNNI